MEDLLILMHTADTSWVNPWWAFPHLIAHTLSLDSFSCRLSGIGDEEIKSLGKIPQLPTSFS
jgi:hypothetical protein